MPNLDLSVMKKKELELEDVLKISFAMKENHVLLLLTAPLENSVLLTHAAVMVFVVLLVKPNIVD